MVPVHFSINCIKNHTSELRAVLQCLAQYSHMAYRKFPDCEDSLYLEDFPPLATLSSHVLMIRQYNTMSLTYQGGKVAMGGKWAEKMLIFNETKQ